MPLLNIIDSLCEKYGYDATIDRDLLLRIINRASKEVYEFDDLPGSLRELVMLVPPESVISLPYYVGELRAMRGRTFKDKIELKEMAPKYSYNSWPETWKNWRILKKSPIQNTIVNATQPISLSIQWPDSVDVEITLTGPTTFSARTSVTLTIEAGETSVQTTVPFTDLISITKNVTNNQNITVTGKDTLNENLILAVIPNDRLQALYTIADVSAYPSGGEQGGTTRYIDVLYKEPLSQLINDGDCFPCEGYDDAIVCKCLEHIYTSLPDGGDKALGYYQKCVQLIYDRTVHTNGASQKQITFAPQSMFNLHPKYLGPYRGYNYGEILGLNR